jgi:hypothetical protein
MSGLLDRSTGSMLARLPVDTTRMRALRRSAAYLHPIIIM